MILYNIRANGPYEYDKFILNIFQIINLLRQQQETVTAADLESWLSVLSDMESAVAVTSDRIQLLARKFLY